jgi:membrane protein DedA with SNARE-associated domain
VQHFIAGYGYAAVFLLMLAESACIPVPSEVIMLFGGALAAGAVPGAHPSLAGIIVAGAAGNVAGSYLAWAAGRYWGQAAVRRWGRRVRLREHHIDQAVAWFDRYGLAAVFFGRLVPVVRTFISLPAGFAEMPAARFGIYTAAGCIPWTAGLGAAGYALGRNWETVSNGIGEFSYVVVALLVIALAAVIVRRRARRTGSGGTQRAAPGPAGGRPVAAPKSGRDWPGAGRQRRALQEAVSAAEFAVLEAQQAGARTGELDAMCLRLRLAVRDADESLGPALFAYGPGRRPGDPLSPAGDLLAAAGLIQDAAASAAASRSQAAAGTPADGLRRQAEAIAARIASAARATARITSPGS